MRMRPFSLAGLRSWWGIRLERRHGGAWLALLITLVIGFLTRVALLVKAAGDVTWDVTLPAAFVVGALYDLASTLWWMLPLIVLLAVLPAQFFARRSGRALAHTIGLLVLPALIFIGVAEGLFWDEFGVRFNFIAVDYLVYTKEVAGNIRESYSIPLILACVLGAGALGDWLLWRSGWPARWLDHADTITGPRWRAAAGWGVTTLVLGFGLRERYVQIFPNQYNRELAKSGLWSLFAAFRANQLDFDRFYSTLAVDAAFKRMRGILAADDAEALANDPHDWLRLVRHVGPEQRLNVIQITVESLSAEFLARYGNRDKLTPNLDALASRALVFDRFYATGTRTDRGMEALTLSVPPTPGRSLVKRPENDHLFTLGSVFRSKGYETAFIYGGFGYFDNMSAFFAGNGYRVIDRAKVSADDITFANVWGACDEDLFRWTIREADHDFAQGKQFFDFVMTTSNHRPFTYPAGKIRLPSKISGRAGGVSYTDYAIGEFLRAAQTKPWFNETIFVFVADHCASSAGKSELPVQNYHIPLFIFAPGGQVRPGVVRTLASQIDYAPTLLGLLGWTYPSRFYGCDLLTNNVNAAGGRALIGNYQKLGFYTTGELVVLQPGQRTATFTYEESDHKLESRKPDPTLIDDAIAYYQTASWLFKHHAQREYVRPAAVP
jgi:hypothetical protein